MDINTIREGVKFESAKVTRCYLQKSEVQNLGVVCESGKCKSFTSVCAAAGRWWPYGPLVSRATGRAFLPLFVDEPFSQQPVLAQGSHDHSSGRIQSPLLKSLRS